MGLTCDSEIQGDLKGKLSLFTHTPAKILKSHVGFFLLSENECANSYRAVHGW